MANQALDSGRLAIALDRGMDGSIDPRSKRVPTLTRPLRPVTLVRMTFQISILQRPVHICYW